MKAIIFYFSLVLAIFHPAFSKALEPNHAHNFELVQKKSPCLCLNSQSDNPYFDIDLLEDEDNDDINSSTWKKFLSKKSASTLNAIVEKKYTDNHFSKPGYNRYIFYLPPSHFISLRVFRL